MNIDGKGYTRFQASRGRGSASAPDRTSIRKIRFFVFDGQAGHGAIGARPAQRRRLRSPRVRLR